MKSVRSPAVLLAAAVLFVPTAPAQSVPLAVVWSTGEHNPAEALVSLDADDDNDDGVPDALETPAPDPAVDDEVVRVTVTGVAGASLHVAAEGGLRIHTAGGLVPAADLPVAGGRATIALVGVAASRRARDAALVVGAGEGSVRVAVTVAAAGFLHGGNDPVFAHRDALALSHEVTNNETLPRSSAWGDASPDPDNVRVEVWDPGADRGTARVEVLGTAASVGLAPGALRSRLGDVAVERPDPGIPLRSRFVRLVGDDIDLRAPGVQGQTVLVGLRDRVHLSWRRPGVAGEATADARVGRPGNEDGPLAARQARWNIHVLRDKPAAQGGRPLIGDDDAGALRIARNQVAIADEIYLQCMVTWGPPAEAAIAVVDPPPPCLLAVGDDDGLTAAGGEVRFRAGGRAIGPVRTRAGWRPIDTAAAVADALRAAGFAPRTTANPRTDYGAGGSVDVVVRDRAGRLVALTPAGTAALSTDRRQSVAIGAVDFTDGLDEFNNLNSSSGTLEERAMIKPLMDDDLTTVDLFIVNRFARGTRIGEAFVEGDSGAILNSLVIDRTGIAAEREAWTQAHEVGHILLNQPWHPDNMGPDRPWLLMDADASLGAVTGPKRLTTEECRRITHESGVGAVPSVLRRYDVARVSPRAPGFRGWPAEALYPRPPSAPSGGVARGPAPAPRAPDPPARSYGIELR